MRLEDPGVCLASEPVPSSGAGKDLAEDAVLAAVPPPPQTDPGEGDDAADLNATAPVADGAAGPSQKRLPPLKKLRSARKKTEKAAELSSEPSEASTALVLASPLGKKRKRGKKNEEQAVSTVVNQRAANQFDEMRRSLLPKRRVCFLGCFLRSSVNELWFLCYFMLQFNARAASLCTAKCISPGRCWMCRNGMQTREKIHLHHWILPA